MFSIARILILTVTLAGVVPAHAISQALSDVVTAAENGDVNAQFTLGRKFVTGDGVPKDDQQAAVWYRKAADQEYAQAQYGLGLLYETSNLVPDYKQAVVWYRKAAAQGDVFAQNKMGQIYLDGQGVPQNYEQAAAWYRKAAEQGDADAQSNLGVMYADGMGVPKDNKQAYAWQSVAVANGAYVSAPMLRDRAAERLTPAQLAEAQALAAHYFEDYQSK